MKLQKVKPDDAPVLELADIQGNVLSAYGKTGFPKARYLVLHVNDAVAGRLFLQQIYPKITSAVRWPSRKHGHPGGAMQDRPNVAVNVAFTFWGLQALGVPVRILQSFPAEFIEGMAARAVILGDDDTHGTRANNWDDVWRYEGLTARTVHMLVTLNAQLDPATGAAVPELETMTQCIRDMAAKCNGVTILGGHGKPEIDYQDLSAITVQTPNGFQPTPKEHFGFTDAISDPVFAGQFKSDIALQRAKGAGKLMPDGSWGPLATGEFLLGYPDEAQEVARGSILPSFARNGTFIAYRKLHQNVVAFRRWLDTVAPQLDQTLGIGNKQAARDLLMAKIAGRWPDGAPLALYPTYAQWTAARANGGAAQEPYTLANFTYSDDPQGAKCPIAAHIRRVNPRDGMGPAPSNGTKPGKSGTALSDRRRILRRGLPYGTVDPNATAEGEHGIVMLVVCASLSRQFEFLQQQWINYGMDAQSGNDADPLAGLHGDKAKFVIPADPESGQAPFIACPLPQFVEMRGGDYFFLPSLSALRTMSIGVLDPT